MYIFNAPLETVVSIASSARDCLCCSTPWEKFFKVEQLTEDTCSFEVVYEEPISIDEFLNEKAKQFNITYEYV